MIWKHQTLIVNLNVTWTVKLSLKSDWLTGMLFQDEQRCWSRNMLHLVKSGSACVKVKQKQQYCEILLALAFFLFKKKTLVNLVNQI